MVRVSKIGHPGAVRLALFLGLVAACSQPQAVTLTDQSPDPIEIPVDCESSEGGLTWENLGSSSLRLIERSGDLEVYAAEYPLPGPTEGLWTQWGQGVVGSDGRHFSAVGDHLGADGNSHFFVYKPSSRTLVRFADVLSVIDRPPGSWGFGKVHAQMVLDRCQRVWAATYWGTRSGITDYEGDHMILIDPASETVIDKGIISDRRGVPSLTISADGAALVVEAVEPESDSGLLVSWDNRTTAEDAQLRDPRHIGYRSLAVAADGRILFSVGSGELAAWDTATGSISTYTRDLPGEWMRATTSVLEDGTLVGVTQNPPRLFTLARSGAVETLGDPGGYTTSLALDLAGQRVFWMANAHGDAWKQGARVMALDIRTGDISEVVRLRSSFESELGLLPGGTYSIQYEDGSLYVGVNASQLSDESGFGTVVLVVIEGL